jgi:ArsR family transcriptional regulator
MGTGSHPSHIDVLTSVYIEDYGGNGGNKIMPHASLSHVFKALGDENRIKIVRLLMEGERCACHLVDNLDVTQPTLSHHMKILCDAGVVTARKEGKWMHYAINREGLEEGIAFLQALSLAPSDKDPSPRCI